jgi:hypothetical protein
MRRGYAWFYVAVVLAGFVVGAAIAGRPDAPSTLVVIPPPTTTTSVAG